jgi:hypothetical protein
MFGYLSSSSNPIVSTSFSAAPTIASGNYSELQQQSGEAELRNLDDVARADVNALVVHGREAKTGRTSPWQRRRRAELLRTVTFGPDVCDID